MGESWPSILKKLGLALTKLLKHIMHSRIIKIVSSPCTSDGVGTWAGAELALKPGLGRARCSKGVDWARVGVWFGVHRGSCLHEPHDILVYCVT
jgi:hypothetical protein